jgi:hypothetical protein
VAEFWLVPGAISVHGAHDDCLGSSLLATLLPAVG